MLSKYQRELALEYFTNLFPRETLHQRIILKAVIEMLEKDTNFAVVWKYDFDIEDSNEFKTVILGLSIYRFKVHEKLYKTFEKVNLNDDCKSAILFGSNEMLGDFIYEQVIRGKHIAPVSMS